MPSLPLGIPAWIEHKTQELFSVHMVAVTEGGRAYTAREIAGMMKTAGFRKISTDRPDPRGVGIVRGTA